jgi:sodium/potassium-transporting ATPase subunit alpha
MPLDWSGPLYKQATAATFAAIVVAQVGNVFACRSDGVSLSQLGWFTNPLVLWGIVTELVVLALIIYTPWGNAIFGTSPLPAWIFGPLALGALALLFAEESRKFIMNRFKNSRAGGVTQEGGTS